MHPVGPLSSRVYWIRRAALVVVAVLVLIGMVWFLANRNSSSARQQSDASLLGQSGSAVPTLTGELAASSVSALPSVLPSASASPSPSAAASPSAPASESAAASPSPSDSAPPASPSEPAPSASPSASVEATSATGSVAPETPASPTEPAPPPTPAAPPPSYDPQGRLLCADADIAVTATTSAPSYPVGQQPRLTLSVTNRGAQPCVRDLSGPLQIFTVFGADGSRIWSTADCFPGQGSDIRELAPGQVVAFTIKWSGTASAPGCSGDRAPVPPGDYTLVAQLGGLSSPPVGLAITG